MEFNAFCLGKTLECSDLIDNAVGEFLARDLHLAAPETLQIGQRRVCADLDAMLPGKAHGGAHMVEVGGMEPAGDVGKGYQRHQRRVVPSL